MKKGPFFLTAMLFIPLLVTALPAALPPEINAASAILLDMESGMVLYEKNADKLIPPASMTKLMTIHCALGFVKAGTVSLDDLVPVSERADFHSLPPRSSLMFIEKGQRVSLMELLKGLALPSGNDAGIAVSEYLAGSVEAFVELMNDEAAGLGLVNTHFEDASGLSEKNLTTAREYASFCRYYINENKLHLDQLHLADSLTYPMDKNLPESGKSTHGPITQPNHNLLIGRVPEVDGLKTGYIDESGYNFAATAFKDDRRLVLVTMGGPGNSSYDGALRRALDAARLFSYGFYAWTEFIPEVPQKAVIPVKGGRKNNLRIQYSKASKLLIETTAIDELEIVPVYIPVKAPVTAGSIIGRWELIRNREIIQSGIITASESIEEGNIFKKIFSR
jgi:D-alanyl-D-alanine carboxypeptidase (penicillin-binding protein 5/6)